MSESVATLPPRIAKVHRQTSETDIALELCLDGQHGINGGFERKIDAPGGFFVHMLDALTKHAGFGIKLKASGDTHIDLHHSVEDTGIALGEAMAEALGDLKGVTRFAHAYAPLDEALSRAVVDLSGRGFFALRLKDEDGMRLAWVTQDFPLTLVEDFFQALAARGRFTLHVDVLEGRNPHHVAESIFKAVALALRQAVSLRQGDSSVPSTKGTLSE